MALEGRSCVLDGGSNIVGDFISLSLWSKC